VERAWRHNLALFDPGSGGTEFGVGGRAGLVALRRPREAVTEGRRAHKRWNGGVACLFNHYGVCSVSAAYCYVRIDRRLTSGGARACCAHSTRSTVITTVKNSE
jgi:hypothetical protein